MGTEISFSEIWNRIIGSWRSLLAVTCIFMVLSMIAMLILPVNYTVQLLLKPVDQKLDGQPASVSSAGLQGALAALSGSGGTQGNDFGRYGDLLSSVPVASVVAADPEIMHRIFRGFWNQEKKNWQPGGIKYYLFDWLYRLAGTAAWAPPDAVQLSDYIAKKVVVTTSITSDLVTLSYDAADPEFGKVFLSKVAFVADDLLRQQAHARAVQTKEYLSQELLQANTQSSRDALVALLAGAEQQMALTQPGVAYAAQAVGEATFSDVPSSPKPLRFMLVGILGGIFLGAIITIFSGDGLWRFLSRLLFFFRKPQVHEMYADSKAER